MKAVIYCRVSTKEQVQNLSLPTQLRTCRDYCQREGLEVAQVFTDAGESAKTTDRPEFQNLLAYCRTHKRDIDTVVVYTVNRFSRNSYDYSVMRTLLLGLGISLRSANEAIGDDPSGAFMGNMLAAAAQYDNDVRAARTKDGMRAALSLGRWTFKAPLGYRNRLGRRGELEPDPPVAALVQTAFEEYGTGRYPKTEVLRRMTALGLRSATGRPLTAQSFGTLLKNPIYAGIVRVASWQLEARGDFEALIPEGLFRKVQNLLAGKGKPVRHHARDHADFPLRRFVLCSHCSAPLTGSWSKGRAKRYAYYHCPKCRRVKSSKGTLESGFTDLLERLRPEPGYLALFRAVVLDVWKARQAHVGDLRTRLDGILHDKQRRLELLEDAFLYERRIDKATYDRQHDKLLEEIALVKSERHDAEIEHIDIEGVLRFAEYVVRNAAKLWGKLDLKQKQQFQQVVFPEGLRFDGQIFGTAVTCLAFNQLGGLAEGESSLASPPGFEPGFWP